MRKMVFPVVVRHMRTHPTMFSSCWHNFNSQDRAPAEPNNEYLANQKEELQRLNNFLDQQKSYDSLLYKFKMLGVESVQPDAKTSKTGADVAQQKRDKHTQAEKEDAEEEVNYRDQNIVQKKTSDTEDSTNVEDDDE